jgi:hypothetical protein
LISPVLYSGTVLVPQYLKTAQAVLVINLLIFSEKSKKFDCIFPQLKKTYIHNFAQSLKFKNYNKNPARIVIGVSNMYI